MSYKLWSIDRPRYFTAVLPTFRGGASLTTAALTEYTKSVGLSGSKSSINRLTHIWYVLGILTRAKKLSRTFSYRIDDFGISLLNQLSFSPATALELMHWTMYSAWLRKNDREWGWSWVYQEVCNYIWESSPSHLVVKELLATSLEKANLLFPNDDPSYDISSIRTVTAWLAALEPPVLRKKEENNPSSPLLSSKREDCSPELLFLAIQLQYSIRNLSFGTPLLIDESIIENVCKTCMIMSEQFWPMVEICDLTFSSLQRKETAYGTSLIIAEPAEFTPPPPRSIKSDSKQGDS